MFWRSSVSLYEVCSHVVWGGRKQWNHGGGHTAAEVPGSDFSHSDSGSETVQSNISVPIPVLRPSSLGSQFRFRFRECLGMCIPSAWFWVQSILNLAKTGFRFHFQDETHPESLGVLIPIPHIFTLVFLREKGVEIAKIWLHYTPILIPRLEIS